MVSSAFALNRGMIDLLNDSQDQIKTAPVQSAMVQERVNVMDIAKFKAEYPDLYAQIVQIGANTEKDRVCAHLEYGKSFNCMDLAVESIESGADLTQTLLAKYNTAGINAKTVADSAEDDPGSSGVADGEDQVDAEDVVHNLVLKKLGYVESEVN